jgi:membrane protein
MSRATVPTDAPHLATRAETTPQARPLPQRHRSKVRQAWPVLRNAVAGARDHEITTTAQALAYSFFLAIPSIFLIALGVFSVVASPDDVERLMDRAAKVMPPEAAQLLGDSLQRSIQSTGSGITFLVVGFALALWSTTSAATTLMRAVTRAFDREDNRSFARKRLLALVLVACFLSAAILVVGLLVLGPALQRWIGGAIGAPSATAWIWWTAQWPLLVAALLFLFAVLLYVGPDVQQPRWQLVTPGAAVSLVIWLVASGAFAFYTAHFGSYNKTWGTLSAVVITLIWLWLASLALLIGAEVNAAVQRAARPRPGSTT